MLDAILLSLCYAYMLINASTVVFMLYVMLVYVFKCMCCYSFYVGKKLYRAYVCNVICKPDLK